MCEILAIVFKLEDFCNIQYPFETHIKLKHRESCLPITFLVLPSLRKFCTGHGNDYCNARRNFITIGQPLGVSRTNLSWKDLILRWFSVGYPLLQQPHHICVVLLMTSSNGNIFRVTDPLCGEFTGHKRPVTRSFDVFFDLHLSKWLSKQSWGWWFETSSRSLWRHCSVLALAVHAVAAKALLLIHFGRINAPVWDLV